MLNEKDRELLEIYNQWETGIEFEKTDGYSYMFRMGVTDDYLEPGKFKVLYYGQECLRMKEKKNQEWIKNYQTVQRTRNTIPGFDEDGAEGVNRSPFWKFYRQLCEINNNNTSVLWSNLNKIHLVDPNNKNSSPLDSKGKPNTAKEPIRDLNAIKRLDSQYGMPLHSIVQREIECLQPDLVFFAIGPKERYVTALAASFGIQPEELFPQKPTIARPACRIDNLLKMGIPMIWTYHPAYLNRIHGGFEQVLSKIRKI